MQEQIDAEVSKQITGYSKEVRSLKIRLTKLEERIRTQEDSDFQLQITNLSNRIDSFSKVFEDKMKQYENELLGLSCYVAAAKINEDTDIFCDLIDNSKLKNKDTIRTQLIADAASVKTDIFSSRHRAHPSGLAVDFHQQWTTYLRNEGINFINM
jgi:flagellar capping protein FliD